MNIKLTLSTLSAFVASCLLSSNIASAKTLEERVMQLEKDMQEVNERVDDNEVASSLSKVRFSLEFNTTMSNFFINNNGLGTNTQANKWMMGLYLNMLANINSYTKFTGRLSMTKGFGDIIFGSNSVALPALDAGRAVGGGPSLYVERAYVDIYGGKHFAFTLGRLPGTDGPGSNLRNNSARMSTYPALVVNALGDGLVATYKPYTNAALRLGYSKIYQPLALDGAGSNIFFGSDKSNTADADLVFTAFETTWLPKNAGENLFMITFIDLFNYAVPYNIGATGAQPDTSANTSTSKTWGDLAYLNLHLESTRMFGSGFSFFASASVFAGFNKKNALFNDGFAFATHLGVRYDFTDFLKAGLEYFYGSKNWYAFSRVSINDPLNFRATKGHVVDFYALYQIDIYQFVRFAYTLQKHNYTTSVAAPTIAMPTGNPRTANLVQNISLSYILRF